MDIQIYLFQYCHIAPTTCFIHLCSPDGHLLATGCTDGYVRVWDLHAAAAAIMAGRTAAVSRWGGGSGSRSHQQSQQIQPLLLLDTALDNCDANNRLDRLSTQELASTSTSSRMEPRPSGMCSAVLCVAFSTGGGPMRVAAGTGPGPAGEDGKVMVWGLVATTPDSATGGTRSVEADASGGIGSGGERRRGSWVRFIGTLKGHVGGITAVAFCPDEEGDGGYRGEDGPGEAHRGAAAEGAQCRIATAGSDGTARLWRLPALEGTGSVCERPERTGTLQLVRDGDLHFTLLNVVGNHFSRKRYYLCCVQAGSSWEEEQILRGHEAPLTCLAFSLDGESLATGSSDSTARIWRMKPFPRGGAQGRGHAQGGVNDAAAAAVSGLKPESREGGVPQGGRWTCMSVLKGHEGEVTSVGFGRDGRQLATGGTDSSAKLWVVSEEGKCLGTVQVSRDVDQDKQGSLCSVLFALPYMKRAVI